MIELPFQSNDILVKGLMMDIKGWWVLYEMPADKPILKAENTVPIFPSPYEMGIWHGGMLGTGRLTMPDAVRPVEIKGREDLAGYSVLAWDGWDDKWVAIP